MTFLTFYDHRGTQANVRKNYAVPNHWNVGLRPLSSARYPVYIYIHTHKHTPTHTHTHTHTHIYIYTYKIFMQ